MNTACCAHHSCLLVLPCCRNLFSSSSSPSSPSLSSSLFVFRLSSQIWLRHRFMFGKCFELSRLSLCRSRGVQIQLLTSFPASASMNKCMYIDVHVQQTSVYPPPLVYTYRSSSSSGEGGGGGLKKSFYCKIPTAGSSPSDFPSSRLTLSFTLSCQFS